MWSDIRKQRLDKQIPKVAITVTVVTTAFKEINPSASSALTLLIWQQKDVLPAEKTVPSIAEGKCSEHLLGRS